MNKSEIGSTLKELEAGKLFSEFTISEKIVVCELLTMQNPSNPYVEYEYCGEWFGSSLTYPQMTSCMQYRVVKGLEKRQFKCED